MQGGREGSAATRSTAGPGLPRLVALPGGGTVALRLMTPDDAALLHAFFCGVPADDLLFLRRDVTDRAVIDDWAAGVAGGRVVTVLAFDEAGVLAGEASLHLSAVPWSRHVGEVRVVVGEGERLHGLGTRLASEIFLVALQRDVRKIVAEMTIEQTGALTVFQKLGFQIEGLLRGHVRDQAGALHDLVIMGHDTEEFYARVAAYGAEELLDEE